MHKQWWALSDLNGRPFGCKPNALTAELSALTLVIVQEAAKSVNGVREIAFFVPGSCIMDASSSSSIECVLHVFYRQLARLKDYDSHWLFAAKERFGSKLSPAVML